MWIEVLSGLVVYKVFRRLFWFDDDDHLDIDTSHSTALFSVANRLEKLYNGKVFAGLRIPNADTGLRENIDMVLVTKGQAVVVSVKNLSGSVSVGSDGSWTCEGSGRNKVQCILDPVEEAKKQISVLESYLEQRGVALPKGYLSCKVVLPNPEFSTSHSSCFPSEVITYEQWVNQKPESKRKFSGWIKGAFHYRKKDMQESIQQNLEFVLGTAPIWDSLELKGKYILGDFLEFKGKQEDIQVLKNIKRSKVSHIVTQKTSMFGLASSRLHVLYCPRDYRGEGVSASEWKEITISSSSEVLFQPKNWTKVGKFKLSSVLHMSLTA